MFPAALVLLCAQAATPFPHVTLKNESIALTVYSPDAAKGFYRGTRFDHAGVIADVKVGGHTVFGKWKASHDPNHSDDITGPAEEFGMDSPLGYAEAKPGEPFLKIGVGLLVKPAGEKAYRFHHDYKVKEFAPWAVTERPNLVTFRQRAALGEYAYDYTKWVVLAGQQSRFTLRHTLKNTGTKRITTDVYNHNFFNVDGDVIGPNYSVGFDAPVRADKPVDRFRELCRIDGKRLTFTGVLDKGTAHALMTGLPAEDDYDFTLTHAPSKLRLKVSGDGDGATLTKFNLWAIGGCVCPEPFVKLDIGPGETRRWDVTYRFEQ